MNGCNLRKRSGWAGIPWIDSVVDRRRPVRQRGVAFFSNTAEAAAAAALRSHLPTCTFPSRRGASGSSTWSSTSWDGRLPTEPANSVSLVWLPSISMISPSSHELVAIFPIGRLPGDTKPNKTCLNVSPEEVQAWFYLTARYSLILLDPTDLPWSIIYYTIH